MINKVAILSAFMLVLVFGCLQASAQSFQPLSRKYQEPQHVTPEVDSLFLQAIGLRSQNTVASAVSDGELNILLVGKDFQGGAAARVEAMRAGHLKSKALSSRADAVMVLSFRARDRKVVLHTLYRGMKVPSYCTRYDTHSKLASAENYLANYFTHVGRRFFIPYVEKLIQSRLLANASKLPLQVGNPLGFKIDAFMEIDLDTFNIAAKEFRRSLGQYGMVMAAFQRLAPRVAAVLQNLVKVRKGLRLRHIHKAGGYQRSFNIAKFVGTALGYVAYATASEYHDTVFQVSTPFYNAWFSRSMTMEEVRARDLSITRGFP